MLTYDVALTDGLEVEIKLHEYPMPNGMAREAKLRMFLVGEPRPVMYAVTGYDRNEIQKAVLEHLEDALVDISAAKSFLDVHFVAASPVNAPWIQKAIRKVWNDVLELGGGLRLAVFQSGPGRSYVAELHCGGNRILFQENLRIVDRNPALNEAVRRLVPYLENAERQYATALARLRTENPFKTY